MAVKTIGNERLESLLETIAEFFPGGQVQLVPRLAEKERGWRLVPSASNPRLAVPADVAKAAATSAMRPCANDRLINKGRRYTLAAVLRSPAATLAMPSGITVDSCQGSIIEHLESVLGVPVCFGLMTGSARANRKPVLGIFNRAGKELGFAKVGLSELAAQLVNNEHRALRAMSSASHHAIQVPRVISYGKWNDKPVLIMSALRPNAVQRPLPLPVDAVRAIIASAPTETTTVAGSPWLSFLRAQLRAMDEVREARQLLEMVEQVTLLCGERLLSFGAWHGDFGAWNMARTRTAPMVWDWERYDVGMPVGLDLMHFAVHDRLRLVGDLDAAITAIRDPRLLAAVSLIQREHGCTTVDARTADLVVLLYLVTLATRFLADGHRYAVSATFRLGCWHVKIIRELLNNTQRG